jgi:uncharacterized protein with FMN-binding domain
MPTDLQTTVMMQTFRVGVIVALWTSARCVLAEDLVEFLSGAKSKGRVIELREDKQQVVIELTLSGRKIERIYPYSKIRAVTRDGKRIELNVAAVGANSDKNPTKRSPKEVQRLIDTTGSIPPDWLKSTPLEYPPTLDLEWPEPAPEPWDNQKNVGQYVWDVLHPNPGKWRGGIKLMMYLRDRHAGDAERVRRAGQTLANMYFIYFQDYPRAAYWFQKTGVAPGSVDQVLLAECYWRLGSNSMALKALDPRRIRVETIKLLGAMGDTKRALKLTELYARQVKEPQWALLAGGDAARGAGDFRKALQYYQRVLDSQPLENADYDHRIRSRAEQSIEAIRLFELLDLSKIPNGRYVDASQGYEGAIEVTVTVRDGRIEQVEVTDHQEKQFYSALNDVPQQIVAKQSVKNIDATSRATITAEAIVSAAAKALSRKGPSQSATKRP